MTSTPKWLPPHHGTIKYAENPPKKYQGHLSTTFDTPDRKGLWTELKSIVDFG